MSSQERTVRGLTLATLVSPGVAIVAIWLVFVPIMLASALAIFYTIWWMGYGGEGHNYVRAWLGASISTRGEARPIWPARPYLMVGPKFRHRIARRDAALRIKRIATLERECGLEGSYEYDSVYQREARELTYA